MQGRYWCSKRSQEEIKNAIDQTVENVKLRPMRVRFPCSGVLTKYVLRQIARSTTSLHRASTVT